MKTSTAMVNEKIKKNWNKNFSEYLKEQTENEKKSVTIDNGGNLIWTTESK